MNAAPLSSTTHDAGGRFASELEESLVATLEGLSPTDLAASGWTVDEISRSLAATPPFSEALASAVRNLIQAS